MKRRVTAVMTLALAAALVFWGGHAFAQNVTESFQDGRIDWSNGIVEAVGIGAPPPNPTNMAQARAMAKRAAVTVARRNLLEIVQGVRIDSRTVIKDFTVESDTIRSEVQGLLQNSQVVDISYMSDGSVEATVAMKLSGPFAELVLPKSIKTIQPVQQPQTPGETKSPGFTGLVVDGRGLKIKPAMAPRILDEQGTEVYGSTYVSREAAVQQGVAGYAKDLNAAQSNPRVTDKPLVVKAIKASDSGPSDIVVTNADAERIKGDPSHLGFLQKCRVMIVLD
jgi:hypothetical protein